MPAEILDKSNTTVVLTAVGRRQLAAAKGYQPLHQDSGAEAYRKGTRIMRREKRAGLQVWVTADLIDGALRLQTVHNDFLDALARKTLLCAVPLFARREDRTEWIRAHAIYFTAIRHMGRSQRERQEFATVDEARAYAQRTHSDGRTMIYAVAPNGESEHLMNV